MTFHPIKTTDRQSENPKERREQNVGEQPRNAKVDPRVEELVNDREAEEAKVREDTRLALERLSRSIRLPEGRHQERFAA